MNPTPRKAHLPGTFFATLLALSTLLIPPVGAAPPAEPSFCATHPAGLEIAHARHELNQRRMARDRDAGLPVKTHGRLERSGQIALLEDDGTVVLPPSTFDLHGQSHQYLRRPRGISAVRAPVGFNSEIIGERVEIGDDESLEIVFPADFRFPFGDEVYDRLFLNSDGNITFGAPDGSSAARSAARFLDGPPRIAALYTDLDPSRQPTPQSGVYVAFIPSRVRITWLDVTEFGVTNRSNLQITLFNNGRALIAYGDTVQAAAGIVGANPWGGSRPLHLMDYDVELPRRPDPSAVAEIFTTDDQSDDFAIAQRFFTEYRDVYDHLVVWLDFARDLGGNAFAFELNTRNLVEGIGLPIFDNTSLIGTTRRLDSFVQMGDLNRYPANPAAPFFRSGENTLGILGHEVGHRWLTRVGFRDTDGTASEALLGRQGAHWSFFFDSDASVMEGNNIEDLGGGNFRTARPFADRYSALDQYLMGLIPPQAVPEFFLVANPVSNIAEADSAPRPGVRFSGARLDLTVNDVIAVEGERIPRAGDARRVFRVGFLLVSDGPARPASIAKVDRIRRAFEGWFRVATSGNGRVRTELLGRE